MAERGLSRGKQGRARARASSGALDQHQAERARDESSLHAPHAGVPFAAYAACAATLVAVFARAIPYPLQLSWDDARFLTDDALVMRPSWDALVAIVTRPQLEAYHPLHLLSYWLDAPWSGADPRVLHTTSLLLWIAAACALLRAMVRLGLGWPRWRAPHTLFRWRS